MWPLTAPITVHLTVFAVLCSSEFMGRCLRISLNSRSDSLKSEAEHYQHCYQRIDPPASACLCLLLTQMANISNILCQQLHN